MTNEHNPEEAKTPGQVAFEAFCNGPQARQSWHAGAEAGRLPWERVADAVLKYAALSAPRADSAESTAGEPLVYETDQEGAWTWLVWAISPAGAHLAVISHSEAKAEGYRDTTARLYPGARVHVERAPVDHTFGASDLRSVAYRAAMKDGRRQGKPGFTTSPAPSPPGVPDSVRALAKRWAETIRNSQRQNGKKEWISLHDTEANEITALLDAISAHPAGQSTGQGADLSEQLLASTKALHDLTAPDSTRTGQVEAEDLNRRATKMIRQCFARAEIPEEISKDTLRAAAFLIGDLEAVIYAARPAAPEAQGAWRSQAADDVLAERRRQVEVEGWTPAHDDGHSLGELGLAAALYALPYDARVGGEPLVEQDHHIGLDMALEIACGWHLKPDTDPRRRLVKAGALILAEIERRDRLPAPPASSGQESA